jgi:hypothetical protein
MLKLFLTTALSLELLLSVGCSRESAASASQLSSADETNELVVVVSPYLGDRGGALELVSDWFIPKPGLHLAFVDGWEATQIADAQVPRVENFSKATVLEKLRKPLSGLIHWTQNSPPTPSGMSGGMLAITKVLSRLQQSGSKPKYMVILGSPVLRFLSDPAHDFKLPRFRYPSHPHFTSVSSPFSCVGRETSLSGVTVVMAFPKEDMSDWPAPYEEQLHGFYEQLIAKRGGRLAAFTPDVGLALRALTQPQAQAKSFAKVSPLEASAEPRMLDSIAQSVAISHTPEPLPVTVKTNAAPPPPVVVVQSPIVTNVVITIFTNPPPDIAHKSPIRVAAENPNQVIISIQYWSTSAVCDLRVTPYAGAEEIAFDNAQTRLGKYVSNVDLRTGEQTKTVTLPAGLEPGKASVALNYASGYGSLRGKVRWETHSGISEMPFVFTTQKGGDRLRQGHRRSKSDYWFVVDLFALTSAQRAARIEASKTHPQSALTGTYPGYEGQKLKSYP